MQIVVKTLLAAAIVLGCSLQCNATNTAVHSVSNDIVRSVHECKVLFSSQINLADELVVLIDNETKSIKTAVYCLMHRKIASALIRAHQRGVKVEILVDPFSVKKRSCLQKITDAGIPLFVWSPEHQNLVNKKKKSLMHEKFCVFGAESVWTGSFNFTYTAAISNQENAVVLNDQKVAAQYIKEFERLKSKGVVAYQEYLKFKS